MNKYKWIEKDSLVLNKETQMVICIDNGTPEAEQFLKYVKDGGLVDPSKTTTDLYDDLYVKVTNKTAQLVNGNGFVYENVNFYTDAIAQQNFTALLIMKDNLSYPYLIWDGNNSVDISDANEMVQFCGMMFAYIASIRTNGKTIRDTLVKQDGESDDDYRIRLENFVDPRD